MSHEEPKTDTLLSASESEAPSWWERSLSRRDAHKLGLSLAAVATVAGCDSEKVAELDSLDAQK